MGIYDRDYYRESTGAPARTYWQTGVCKWLVIITVGVWVLQLLSPAVEGLLLLWPPAVTQDWQIWRLLTAAFCHSRGNFFHILWNMLFLWWFGRELERMYGSAEFLAFYLTAAAFASICYLLLQGTAPMEGASGAVLAVVTVYTLYYPRHRVYFYGIFPIEMRWLLLVFLAGDLFPLLTGAQGTGVAHAAHLGGAVYGLIFKFGDLRLGRLLAAWRNRPRRTRLRVVRPERYQPAPAPTPPSRLDDDLAGEVDRILAKISEHGTDSLSQRERETLEQASRKLRQRR